MENKEKVEHVVETEAKEVTAPEMVEKARYDELLNQALALQARYEKLSELFNTVLEKFISGQNPNQGK
jgi:hypothetical protein